MAYFRKGILFILLFCVAGKPSMAQGFLRANGKRIENDSSKNFILRGMGLGGFMLQEGYMFGLSFLGQQYKIKEKIAAFAGKEKAAYFYDEWLKRHTAKTDIDSLAAWGFNSVRLPIHFNLFTLPVKEEPVKGQQTWLPRGFEMVDSLLKWCSRHRMYLILDLHAAPGGQGNDLPISDRDPAEPSLWQSDENKIKTIALWKKLAERYANEIYIGGYDILNETNWGFTNEEDKRGIDEKENIPLRKLLTDITAAIRSVDKNHIIFLEGNGFANNYRGIFPLWDNNMVVSFHKYGNYTTAETIQKFLDYRKKYNVPLWLGETGENSNTWFTNNIRLMEDNDIGWCWWQLKKMDIRNPLEIRKPANYQLFLDFCAGKAFRPDEQVAGKILDEWLDNLEIQNNVYHPDVIDAMFRQVHSLATLPFKPCFIKDEAVIDAVDYDLGRNGYAYLDKDTASYIYTPGVHTQGNRGSAYRNDGVDIMKDAGGKPYVFHIEPGEWLLYTVNVEREGKYLFSMDMAGVPEGNHIVLYRADQPLSPSILLPVSEDSAFHMTRVAAITLQKGLNRLKIFFVDGHIRFRSFALRLDK